VIALDDSRNILGAYEIVSAPPFFFASSHFQQSHHTMSPGLPLVGSVGKLFEDQTLCNLGFLYFSSTARLLLLTATPMFPISKLLIPSTLPPPSSIIGPSSAHKLVLELGWLLCLSTIGACDSTTFPSTSNRGLIHTFVVCSLFPLPMLPVSPNTPDTGVVESNSSSVMKRVRLLYEDPIFLDAALIEVLCVPRSEELSFSWW